MKNRKAKQKEYDEKYGHIPSDYNERIAWMDEQYKLNDKIRQDIINRASNIINNVEFYDFLIVLYMVPENTARPRFRLITPKNYASAALQSPYVHVYQPMAAQDHRYLRELMNSEIVQLEQFIQTPFACDINAFFPTPSVYNRSDKFIAEMGLDYMIQKPDVDNVMKHYFDMFNASVWIDDSMCISGRLTKFYSIKPRVEINIRYSNCAMNKYQYDRIINRTDYRDNNTLYYLDKLGLPTFNKEENK